MPETRSTVFTQPGDTFHTHGYQDGAEIQAVTLCADHDRWYMGPLTIHGDIPTLLALADSLVAACWQLKTAADVAAVVATQNESRTTGNFITADEAIAAFTPADPEVAAEG